MRWRGQRQSDNIEDLRGGGGGKGKVIGGGIGALVIALIVYLMGGDPSQVLQQAGNVQQTEQSADKPYVETENEKDARQFTATILAQTEDVWTKIFSDMGETYEKPKLALFNGEVQSACGEAASSTGPFYCPGDKMVYIDLSFYDLLKNKLNSPGDFAMAYVIAHEVGHHIQNLMGISAKVNAMRGRIG